MCGKVGSDAWGVEYIENMKKFGINTNNFTRGEAQTGIASIFVAESGANSIVIIPGANNEISTFDVDAVSHEIQTARILVCQNEIPLTSTMRALEIAREHNTLSILNPAPASPSLVSVINLCDIVCPNETELAVITGMPVDTIPEVPAGKSHLFMHRCL